MTPGSWLWLYGPSGTGKTAVGYELFKQLGADYRMGYVEIDQLGMCLPADEPGRARIKVANLFCALRNFRDADVDGVVVSGDIAGAAMDEVLRSAATRPILCRLRAQPATFEARLRSRGAPADYAQDARTYDDRFDHVGDLDIVTDELTVEDVAAEIRRRMGAWPRDGRRRAGGHARDVGKVAPASKPPEIAVLVCGPTASGKSAVAWEVYMASVASGVQTAYLDLAQIGFLRPPDDADPNNVRLKARNVAALWRTFAEEGADRLVLSGEVAGQSDIDAYRRALSGARLAVYALTASRDELIRRTLMRGHGLAVQLPGDELIGRSAAYLRDVATAAAKGAAVLRESIVSDLHLDTDGFTVANVAMRITSDAFPKVGEDAT